MKKSAQEIVRRTRGRDTGNALGNVITGTCGNNTLDGGAGGWSEAANDAVFEMRRVG